MGHGPPGLAPPHRFDGTADARARQSERAREIQQRSSVASKRAKLREGGRSEAGLEAPPALWSRSPRKGSSATRNASGLQNGRLASAALRELLANCGLSGRSPSSRRTSETVDNSVNEHLVHIGARVEPDLAEAVARLADAGDRSVSREIRRAIREHVAQQVPGTHPPLGPETPVERSETSDSRRQSSSPPLAGSGETE
jgi:hypothetical protein